MPHCRYGTSGRTRTDTLSPETDFESAASTNSATEALLFAQFGSISHKFQPNSVIFLSDKPNQASGGTLLRVQLEYELA